MKDMLLPQYKSTKCIVGFMLQIHNRGKHSGGAQYAVEGHTMLCRASSGALLMAPCPPKAAAATMDMLGVDRLPLVA